MKYLPGEIIIYSAFSQIYECPSILWTGRPLFIGEIAFFIFTCCFTNFLFEQTLGHFGCPLFLHVVKSLKI